MTIKRCHSADFTRFYPQIGLVGICIFKNGLTVIDLNTVCGTSDEAPSLVVCHYTMHCSDTTELFRDLATHDGLGNAVLDIIIGFHFTDTNNSPTSHEHKFETPVGTDLSSRYVLLTQELDVGIETEHKT
jgi:hypothetical protein